ncbi:MAG: hotdog fold thioesterase [Bacteroidetes bacterium]|nr:MAG: hotdog fold thioesterase [Bacteroidota bacterium]
MKSPQEIVQLMMEKDAFSQWLGIEVLEVGLGHCSLKAMVTEEMINGHQTLHGGITYSISDSALAFSSNSRGFRAVSIETSISHIKKCFPGDTLTAYAKEVSRGRTIGIYEVEIFNQNQVKVSHFKGTVFISTETW